MTKLEHAARQAREALEPTHEGDGMNDIDPGNLSEQDITCLRDLRKRGFAVAVFTPNEIGESDPESVEDSMIEAGWRRIEYTDTEETA